MRASSRIIGTKSSGQFDPRSIANLYTWYDAADSSTITQSGGFVSQLNDRSGNGRNLTQSTSSYQPRTGINTLGGRNTITFDGIDDFLWCNISLTSNNLTFFIIYNRFSGGDTYGRLLSMANTYGANDYSDTNGFEIHTSAVSFNGVTPPLVGGYRNNAAIASIAIAYGTPYLTNGTLNGGNFSVTNGTTASSNTSTGTTSTTSISSGVLAIGSSTQLTDQNLSGYIGEHLIYNRVLNAGEIDSIRSYLLQKWSI